MSVTTGVVVRRFEGHAQRLNSISFAGCSTGTPGGGSSSGGGESGDTVLLTASYDRTVKCWDMRSRSREPIQTLVGFRDSVTSVCAGPHEIIAGCVDGAVRVFDLRAGLCHTDELGAGGSSGGGGTAGGIRTDTRATGRVHRRAVTSVSLSNDGKCLLASCTGNSPADSGLPVSRHDLPTAQAAGNCGGSGGGGHEQSSLSPPRYCTASVVLLEKATGAVLNSYAGHQHVQYALQSCLTHTDAEVVSGCESGAVLVWDLMEGSEEAPPLQRLEGFHQRPVAGVACHPSDDAVVTCSYDGTAIVWKGPSTRER